MSQRNSGYDRQDRDLYETPSWVTKALLPYIPTRANDIWEPACGSGKMLDALKAAQQVGGQLVGTDIANGIDFLDTRFYHFDAVITNPPFKLSRQFIEHALETVRLQEGFVAMLLPSDYDHAKTRQHLFSGCPQFSKRLVLTKRIVWFERPGAAPSSNHSWWMWDWQQRGSPTIHYQKLEN